MQDEILDIIACPLCKGKLRYNRETQELVCNFDKLAYPICEGVPVMLLEEARKIEQVERSTRS